MDHPSDVDSPLTARRGFLARLGGGALGMAALPWWRGSLAASGRAWSATSPGGPKDARWLERIRGRHRQLFDATDPHGGDALIYAKNFLDQYNRVYRIHDAELTAVIVLRHFATPLALDDAVWARYQIGKRIDVTDPVTQSPAVRNIFARDDAQRLPERGMSVAALTARGTIVVVCETALVALSRSIGASLGISATRAEREWRAGLLPGTVLVSAGVVAVNQAQERGCTYCSA